MVVLSVAAGCGHATHASSPTTNNSVTTTVRSARLNSVELNAALGEDVPPGWAPVDRGAARVFVPSDWNLAPRSLCLGGAPGMISVDILPNAACAESGTFAPKQAAALLTPRVQRPAIRR